MGLAQYFRRAPGDCARGLKAMAPREWRAPRKQRLVRWLLMMRDRSDDDILPITQNLLAEMLGVQRPTITNAIRVLEPGGPIECRTV
jgi:CRP-like cAMP-binding protein